MKDQKWIKHLVVALLAVVSGLFWRIGGKGGFANAKLFRRIGTPLCGMLTLFIMRGSDAHWIATVFALMTLIWGSCSYFGWLNRFHPYKSDCENCGCTIGVMNCLGFSCVFCSRNGDKCECTIESEYWWNFLAESLVILSGAMAVMISMKPQLWWVYLGQWLIYSGVLTWTKRFIDELDYEHRDVVSEFMYGFMTIVAYYFLLK